jgi:hypothetical protein
LLPSVQRLVLYLEGESGDEGIDQGNRRHQRSTPAPGACRPWSPPSRRSPSFSGNGQRTGLVEPRGRHLLPECR